MTELRLEKLVIPGAEIGPENPLPALAAPVDSHSELEIDPSIPEEDREYIGYGRPPSCLPYRLQDGYSRERSPRAFRTAVLENEILRATFLLELGGRLYSLRHKPSGKELIEANPVFQPANLGIRNAWFSGGVEWNIGLVGHCPFTCSPLFAARVDGPGGTPVLRLYEWERIRCVPFQMDFYLPEGSPLLFLRASIRNPNPREVPMYWWSNIGVTEAPGTRVIVPAEQSFTFGYQGSLSLAPVPARDGTDISYPTNSPGAADYFFRLPDGQWPWIASLGEDGQGLIQVSTDLLKGRKLFVWGMGSGSRHWQEFLSEPGRAYFEIQAGLARTQAEHLPMPAGAEWSWLEAYGMIEAEPAVVHGESWHEAVHAVESGIEELIPRAELAEEFSRGAALTARAPAELLQRGSGWGALEEERRRAAGEPAFSSSALPFDQATLGPEQAAWLKLLWDGQLPEGDPSLGPESYMVQPEWRECLEGSIARGGSDHWLGWLHVGIMRYHAGEKEPARQALETSLRACETPWALHCLATVARNEERWDEAADLLEQAMEMRPDLLPLAAQCGRALIEAERPERWLEWLERLPTAVLSSGRIVALKARALLAAGQFERVEEILAEAPLLSDLREGELSLSELWFGLHEQRLSRAEGCPVDEALRERVRREFPPPYEIDFQMKADSE